jgi:hypothetical protein
MDEERTELAKHLKPLRLMLAKVRQIQWLNDHIL